MSQQKQCCIDSKKKGYKFCPQCGKQLINEGLNLTVAVCGQGAVGKSNITLAYIKNEFVDVYDPTILDSYDKVTQVDDQIFKIHVLDTAGQDEYKSLRPEFMRSGDVFLCVFDLTSKASLGILEQYIGEIRVIKGDSFKIVIVGNKSDLNRGENGVTSNEGMEFAKKFDAPYIETSALKREGIDEAFELAIRLFRGTKKEVLSTHEEKPKVTKNKGFFSSISDSNDIEEDLSSIKK